MKVEQITESQARMGEFVALMALSMSLVALSIDVMLPAFPEMARDLGVGGENDIQLVVSMLFTGLAVGQLFYGPLSDSIGRKPAIYLGFALFVLGSLLSMVASDFTTILAGRFLQGIGAAGPRTVSVALIRDRFAGDEMARVMSFIMTIFILVPIFAPALGQAIVWLANWRVIFGVLVVLAMLTVLWLGLRQAETLPRDQRQAFTLQNIVVAFRAVLSTPVTVVYTLVAGCVSGAFLGYLNSSQQIFQALYGLGFRFPLYFAILALAVGSASLLNGRLVMRFGMHRLANRALLLMALLSWLFLLVVWFFDGTPPLWLFMSAGFVLFFCIGVLFGNLNAIAMEPLGHVAGMAASVIGSTTTLVAVLLGFLIGRAYDGTLMPLAAGFVTLSTLAMLLVARRWK
jgi:DHA1 family bicyclomycin/chloramphenicol resistance-like MFS transporter